MLSSLICCTEQTNIVRAPPAEISSEENVRGNSICLTACLTCELWSEP